MRARLAQAMHPRLLVAEALSPGSALAGRALQSHSPTRATLAPFAAKKSRALKYSIRFVHSTPLQHLPYG
jgi:hypothetical protein